MVASIFDGDSEVIDKFFYLRMSGGILLNQI